MRSAAARGNAGTSSDQVGVPFVKGTTPRDQQRLELDLLGDIHVAVVYGTDFGPHSTVPAIVGMCEPGTFDGGVPVVSGGGAVTPFTTPDTGPSD